MLQLLEALVCMESPSHEPTTQAAPLNLLQQFLQTLGYRTIRIPGRNSGGHLYAGPTPTTRSERRQARRWQLLLGHCDTVWPVGTLTTMPFFREGNALRGPGIYDMKAGLVEVVFALKAIRDLQAQPTVMPVVLINSDEEIGSRESTRYVRALARGADRALVLEPSLGPSGKLKTVRKGVGRFTITVRGKAAHAGLDPTAGASAILELSHVIQKLFALNDPERHVSVNVGVIDGGVRANVVAPESTAVVDVRVADHHDGDRVEHAIRSLTAETPGVTVNVEGGIGRPPLEPTPANRQLWRVAVDLARELDVSLDEGIAGGASDGNTTSQYTATLDGLGAVGDGAHADNEYIQIDKLTERCALLVMLLLVPPLSHRAEQLDDRP